MQRNDDSDHHEFKKLNQNKAPFNELDGELTDIALSYE